MFAHPSFGNCPLNADDIAVLCRHWPEGAAFSHGDTFNISVALSNFSHKLPGFVCRTSDPVDKGSIFLILLLNLQELIWRVPKGERVFR